MLTVEYSFKVCYFIVMSRGFKKSSRVVTTLVKAKVMSQVIRLREDGFSWKEIGCAINTNVSTIMSWTRNNPRFSKALDDASKGGGSRLVEHSLIELVKGAKEESTTIEYKEERLVKGELVEVKVTKRSVVKAPSDKAVAMLAYKYAKGEYTNEDKTVEHTIRITGRERSLSLEERKSLLLQEGSDVVDVDYKVLVSELEEEATGEGLLGV